VNNFFIILKGGEGMKQWLTRLSICLLAITLSIGVAEGAGTLKVTFKSKAANGVETPISYAYVYLRDAAVEPPVEKYFSPADYILGPSDSLGRITANVPEGTYYVRITGRNPLASRPLGPPETGDYTWNTAKTITISTNTITDLGTKIAWAFGSSPVVISGTVKNSYGTALAGRYVKATIVPCEGDYSVDIPTNYCGPEKHIALQRTDSSGNYRILLMNPGTFYLYASTCLGDRHQEFSGNPCVGTGTGPVTVTVGEQKTVNIVSY
jgi:hypothetical protein